MMEEQSQQEDIYQYFQEGDIQVRDDSNSEDEEESEEEAANANAMNDDIEQFMPASSDGVLIQSNFGEGDQLIAKQASIQSQINNSIKVSNDGHMTEEEITFYNECLVYTYFKLKEYQNAKILSEEIISKLQKSIMFAVNDSDEDIPFPLRYLNACSSYEMRNTKDALKILYQLLADTDKTLKKQSASYSLFDPFGMSIDNSNNQANTNQVDFSTSNVLDMEDDDFGVFDKVPQQKTIQATGKNIDFNVGGGANTGDNETKERALKLLRKEQNELFGLFPPKDKYEAKYIMLIYEITRIHQRQQDYRNAYIVIQKLVKVKSKQLKLILQKYPLNPYILSRMGRLCLEIGRKTEANDYFNQVAKMMRDSASPGAKKAVQKDIVTQTTEYNSFEQQCNLSNDYCGKSAKDNVNAAVYVQQKSQPSLSVSQSQNLSASTLSQSQTAKR
ncbi:UNKNOWN [Stylonychia lemnae]|uniref:Tetratricopeptide repeat protein n=1 Tax=Stylonychia lemnae TaxID=5949 RepID=A0A078A2W1_STYLE|nr:UNKNOWN [Stylonychia lemnae]|eukprot:CDW76455.1 UNKNOWN [Stylonychia lemnae]